MQGNHQGERIPGWKITQLTFILFIAWQCYSRDISIYRVCFPPIVFQQNNFEASACGPGSILSPGMTWDTNKLLTNHTGFAISPYQQKSKVSESKLALLICYDSHKLNLSSQAKEAGAWNVSQIKHLVASTGFAFSPGSHAHQAQEFGVSFWHQKEVPQRPESEWACCIDRRLATDGRNLSFLSWWLLKKHQTTWIIWINLV